MVEETVVQEESQSIADVSRSAREELGSLLPETLSMDGDGEAETPEPSSEDVKPEAAPETDAAGEKTEEVETPPEQATETKQQDTDKSVETKEEESPDDYRHFYDQYKDDDARARALHENKVYAAKMSRLAREREAELAETKAELEKYRSRPEPTGESSKTTDVPKSPPQDLQQVFETLAKEDPQVRADANSFLQLRAQRDEIVKEEQAIRERAQIIDQQRSKNDAVIEYNKELLKANPESEELQREITRMEMSNSHLLAERAHLLARYQQAQFDERENNAQRADLEKRLMDKAQEYQTRGEREAKEQEEYNTAKRQFKREWSDAFDRYCSMKGITDEEEKKDANDLLIRAAYPFVDEIEDFMDFFMGAKGEEALAPMMKAKKRAVAQYTKTKRQDATQVSEAQRKPGKPSETDDKNTSETPSASKTLQDIHRESGAQLSALLGAG